MATATATFALRAYPQGLEKSIDLLRAHGTITIGSGGTYATGGLSCPITDPKLVVPSTPFSVKLAVENSAPTGYVYSYDVANEKVRIFEVGASTSAPLAELGSGASVTADTLACEALFTKSGQ